MRQQWMGLGDIMRAPDGSNMRPVATYPVVSSEVITDDLGQPMFKVDFEREERYEELYKMEGSNVSCVRYARQIVPASIITRNLVMSEWILQGNVLTQRKAFGASVIDSDSGDTPLTIEEAHEVAVAAAMGQINRSVIDGFRPVTDERGNLMVNPHPVAVAKRN